MGSVRSVTTNGSTLYLSTDYEDSVTRFDFNTGPGRGTVYATEAYNGIGERLGRVDAAGIAHYPQYDGASPGAPLLYDSAGGSVYTPGIAQRVNGRTLYTNVNALGSVHDAQTDGNSTQDAARYDAFGGLVARQGSDAFPLGFAASSSYQTDSDTGLMLLDNRYYDPSTGRFMSQDRVHDGTNWYAYCGNDPLSYVDPEGLDTETVTTIETTTTSVSYDAGKTWKVESQTSRIVDQYSFEVPDGVDLEKNITEARAVAMANPVFEHPHGFLQNLQNEKNWSARLAWYLPRVIPHGTQDYKNRYLNKNHKTNYEWDAVGNWNAGAEAQALGYSWPDAKEELQKLHLMFHPGQPESQVMQQRGYDFATSWP